MSDIKDIVKDVMTINEESLLSTDYANYFNEVSMSIGMLLQMPEMIEDLNKWEPKSYEHYFLDSSLPDKEKIIEAYNHSPDIYKTAFSSLVSKINNKVLEIIAIANMMDLQEEDGEDILNDYVSYINKLISYLVGVVNCNYYLDEVETEIVSYSFNETSERDLKDSVVEQDDIDSLF